MTRVFIDIGHGGKDSGATYEKIKESDINLKIGEKLKLFLNEYRINHFIDRHCDREISLKHRSEMANEFGFDLFISIHCNATENEGVEGIETWYYKGSVQGFKLATIIQDQLISGLKQPKNRGTKETETLYVLKNTKLTSILIECGFLSNSTERHLLNFDGYQYLIAENIAKGIKKYLEVLNNGNKNNCKNCY